MVCICMCIVWNYERRIRIRGHYTLFCNVYSAETLLSSLLSAGPVQCESAVYYWSRDTGHQSLTSTSQHNIDIMIM